MNQIYLYDLEGRLAGDAVLKLNDDGVEYRIVSDGKENFIVTADFQPERVNLCLSSGVVLEAYFG